MTFWVLITLAHSVLQYFSNFICINSLEFMSPDILSWWKVGRVCFYSCICCYKRQGGNLFCPRGWKAFQRIDGSPKKAVGSCQEGTAREMLRAEFSAESSFSLGWLTRSPPSESPSCRTRAENTATFFLLAILSTNVLQEVFGRSCKSKCGRRIWTLALYNVSWSPNKTFTETEVSLQELHSPYRLQNYFPWKNISSSAEVLWFKQSHINDSLLYTNGKVRSFLDHWNEIFKDTRIIWLLSIGNSWVNDEQYE